MVGGGQGVELHVVAPAIFGIVKGPISPLEQAPYIGAAIGQSCSQTDGGVKFCLPTAYRHIGDAVAHPFGHVLQRLPSTTGHHDQELFAAITSQKIIGTQGSFHASGNFKQDFIPCGMAVTIINALEMVYVYEYGSQAVFFAGTSLHLTLQQPHDGAAVVETGKAIMAGPEL